MSKCDICGAAACCVYQLGEKTVHRCEECCDECKVPPDRVKLLERRVTALCDAIQWIVNRGTDKVPTDVMKKIAEGGT